MASELFLAPSFRQLESELLENLDQACRLHPLAPKWVVVPTATVASHLRLALASDARREVRAGIRVVPFDALISKIGENRTPSPRGRWSPHLDFLLMESVRRLPDESPLAKLKSDPVGYTRLKATFLDLADTGIGPEQGDLIRELAERERIDTLEQDVLSVYLHFLDVVSAAGLDWHPLVQQEIAASLLQAEQPRLAALLGAERPDGVQVHVHGFYDFTDVNLDILTGLSRSDISLYLYLPYHELDAILHPAFAFTASLIEELEVRIGTSLARSPVRKDFLDGLDRFLLQSFPSGSIEEPPASLSHQKASGLRAEALSAAVSIRSWMDDDDPLSPEEILVVAPRIGPYLPVIQELFTAFSIPFQAADPPAADEPPNLQLRSLVRLLTDQVPAEWLLLHLRELPADLRFRVDLNSFEERIRKLPVWGGETWLRLHQGAVQERSADGPVLFSNKEVALIDQIRRLWKVSRKEAFSTEEALGVVSLLQDRWLADPEILVPLADAFAYMEKVYPEMSISAMALWRLLESAAEETRTEKSRESGVQVCSFMRARGLTAKGVVVLGLSADQFPFRIEEDPFLSDSARLQLSRHLNILGHRLPKTTGLADEMALLFYLINTAAPRVHWVIPETDEAGKSVAPTPWVQRYLQAWNGAPNHLLRVPRGPAEQARLLVRQDPEEGAFLPPDFVSLLTSKEDEFSSSTHYGYLRRTDLLRAGRPEWNGLVPGYNLQQQQENEASKDSAEAEPKEIHVTRLENLARCPYRYYVEDDRRWSGLEPLEFGDGLSPLIRGSILHELLDSLIQSGHGQELALAVQAKQILADVERRIAERMERLSPGLKRSFRLLPGTVAVGLVQGMRRIVRRYFEAVVSQQFSDGLPLLKEHRIGLPFPGLESVQISGKIDRLDRRENKEWLMDYKSGKIPQEDKTFKLQVRLGYRIQAVLYPWLYAAQQKKEPPEFCYIYLGQDPPKELSIGDVPDAEALLQDAAEILQRGAFFATSNESLERVLGLEGSQACRFCRSFSLCRRFDGRSVFRSTKFLNEYLERRPDRLLAPGGE